MAGTKPKAAAEKEIVLVRDVSTLQQQQTADELRELAKHPLDKTRPGGRYASIDGTMHDAHGNELEPEVHEVEHIKQARVALGMSPDPEDDQPAGGGGTEPTAADLKSFTIGQLQDEAARRGVTVQGKGGKKAVKADYVAALGG